MQSDLDQKDAQEDTRLVQGRGRVGGCDPCGVIHIYIYVYTNVRTYVCLKYMYCMYVSFFHSRSAGRCACIEKDRGYLPTVGQVDAVATCPRLNDPSRRIVHYGAIGAWPGAGPASR